MYRTCLYCRSPLERNESIEALPIGRRVAFDAKRGRLWVVCRRCERWNLTPFDARWEAIEQAERAFRDTRVRVSTDNIGLARLREGTELVRIGEPLRPEFAAWRYGDQFGRRRRRTIMTGAGIAVGATVAIGGALAAGVGVALVAPFVQIAAMTSLLGARPKTVTRLADPEGGTFLPVGFPRLIESDRADGWGVDVAYAQRLDAGNNERRLKGRDFEYKQNNDTEVGRLALHGAEALPLLRWALPRVNTAGARDAAVRDGVQVIEDVGGPDRVARWAVQQRRERAARATFGDNGDLRQMPVPVRLAFEMAVFEDAERRAMEGELAALERAWADAEGVAAIADSLAIPARVEDELARLKGEPRER